MVSDATCNDRIRRSMELEASHPEYFRYIGSIAIRCENGCGVVINLLDAHYLYKRNEHGDHLAICECCAAEEGHVDEENETPETSPVCRRKPKEKIR